jgi:hypothetical protein
LETAESRRATLGDILETPLPCYTALYLVPVILGDKKRFLTISVGRGGLERR